MIRLSRGQLRNFALHWSPALSNKRQTRKQENTAFALTRIAWTELVVQPSFSWTSVQFSCSFKMYCIAGSRTKLDQRSLSCSQQLSIDLTRRKQKNVHTVRKLTRDVNFSVAPSRVPCESNKIHERTRLMDTNILTGPREDNSEHHQRLLPCSYAPVQSAGWSPNTDCVKVPG